MGQLSLPASGLVYVDANCVIYSVERVQPFGSLLEPLWEAAAAGQVQVVSSQITFLETLVRPIREGVGELEAAFRAFLLESREFRLVPIDIGILDAAARIRAEVGLGTPDAIHAATAFSLDADMLVTNDASFLRFKGVPVSVLSQVLAARP